MVVVGLYFSPNLKKFYGHQCIITIDTENWCLYISGNYSDIYWKEPAIVIIENY